MPQVDIHQVIVNAKLGSARKDAQVDTCTAFAAALYDVLTAAGIPCGIVTACRPGVWAHSVVRTADGYFDSKGVFSTEIHRQRAKIHPKVNYEIEFQEDQRNGCYDDEFELMYIFYLKALQKTLNNFSVEKAMA